MSPHHTAVSWVDHDILGESRRTMLDVSAGDRARGGVLVVIDRDLTAVDAAGRTDDPAHPLPRVASAVRHAAGTAILRCGPDDRDRR